MQRDENGIIDGSVSLSGSEEYRLIRDSEARELFKSSQNTLFQEEKLEVHLECKIMPRFFEERHVHENPFILNGMASLSIILHCNRHV